MNVTVDVSSVDLSKPLWRLDPLTYAVKLSMESDSPFRPYRFHQFLMAKLLETLYKPSARIIISAPPQHGKTECLFWFVTWFLDLFPHKSVIWTSYDQDLAVKYGSRIRDVFIDNPLSNTEVNKKKRGSNYWETTKGGEERFVSMGGGITGSGGDLIIVDDPVKDGKVYLNPKTIKDQINWMNKVLLTRTRGHAPIIIVQTRWHEEDLAGYLLENSKYEWEFINLKAIAEEDDPIGRQVGEALCQERQPLEVLKMKQAEDPVTFSCMYQGNPIPSEGGIWPKRLWQRWIPAMIPLRWQEKIISIDATFDDTEKADDCAFHVWGRSGQSLFLLDAIAEKMDFDESLTTTKLLLARHPDTHAVLIEKKANGPAIKSLLKKNFQNIVMVEPLGNKIERAEACKPFLKAGLVHIPMEKSTNWDEKFIDQVTRFPRGKNDDHVDAASQAILYLQDVVEKKAINVTHTLSGWRFE